MTEINDVFSKFESKAYKTEPMEFHQTSSPYFKCLFAERGNDLIFQFYKNGNTTLDTLYDKVKPIFENVLGELKKALKVEKVYDEMIEGGESVFVEVRGLRNNNFAKSKLFRDPFVELHNTLTPQASRLV
jgi:hypothetical protein